MAVDKLSKEDYKKQHIENYKKALIEIVSNNNKGLINEDILSLIKKPPLDSMDTIKTKLLMLAKEKKVVLENASVDKIIEIYREKLSETVKKLLVTRKEEFIKMVEDYNPSRETEILKIELKDFISINKKIESGIKKEINNCVNMYFEKHLDAIYKPQTKKEDMLEINNKFLKYLTSDYRKKLLSDIEIKLIVKDRTLINGVNEQGERYLFMLEKSYLLK